MIRILNQFNSILAYRITDDALDVATS